MQLHASILLVKSIHPFPARMAPELALERVSRLDEGAVVLDPMMGSGTVIRQALDAGHRAIGYDSDPLSVLMSRVATRPCKAEQLGQIAETVVKKARSIDGRSLRLDWIDDDPETSHLTKFWFDTPQRIALRKIAKVFGDDDYLRRRNRERDALWIALSRLIVTKEQRASLARDTSRSRPHRVTTTNDFDVYKEFVRSARRLEKLLKDEVSSGEVMLVKGDARNMDKLENDEVDAVITSPPYLNAIDYLRGHKLSLIWMGYSASKIREIRSGNIGAERGPDTKELADEIQMVVSGLGALDELPPRYRGMIDRYAIDLYALLKEVARVLKVSGQATFVVGNSCLRGVFVRNSGAVAKAAEIHGLNLLEESERELPAESRSLPMLDDNQNALSRRMRTESVMTFEKCAA